MIGLFTPPFYSLPLDHISTPHHQHRKPIKKMVTLSFSRAKIWSDWVHTTKPLPILLSVSLSRLLIKLQVLDLNLNVRRGKAPIARWRKGFWEADTTLERYKNVGMGVADLVEQN